MDDEVIKLKFSEIEKDINGVGRKLDNIVSENRNQEIENTTQKEQIKTLQNQYQRLFGVFISFVTLAITALCGALYQILIE